MVNFKIVEQKSRNLDEIYDDFKKDFLNPKIYTKELKQKYGLGKADYHRLSEQVKQETGLELKPTLYQKYGKHNNPDKYIHTNNTGKKYSIVRMINGKRKSFGRYNTLKEARKKRDELEKNNWRIK